MRAATPPAAALAFCREVVRRATDSPDLGATSSANAKLGILIDLAHINPKGFEEIVDLTTKPLIVSHTNARKFYDIERNVSDEQIKVIGQRGGVVGVNAILVSSTQEKSTLDHYVDHIEHVIGLIGIDGVGIGFDFCEYLFS